MTFGKTLLTLGLISAALSTAAVAAPIEYRFSWEGSATLVQSLVVNAGMRIAGNTANVVVGPDFAVNTGPLGNGSLTGEFSALGLTAQESGLTVLRDSLGAFDFLTFSKNDPESYEVALNATGVPGIQAYDLKTAFGPVVTGPGSSTGALTFDLGVGGVLAFSGGIGAGGFVATTATSGAISYDFSWTGPATLTTQLVNASFQMTFQADTGDVIAHPDLAVNVGPSGNGLTGEFSGAGLLGQFPGFDVVREHLNNIDSLYFTDLTQTQEVAVLATGFPGIDTYDLRSAFGPVNGPGGGNLTLDFGADGVLSFTGIRSATFEAIQIATVPEPASLALLSLALAGLGWSRRKK